MEENLADQSEELVALVWEKLDAWLEQLVAMLPNLAAAVLIVLLAGLVARLASNLVRRATERTGANTQVVSLLTMITRLGVLVFGTFIALGVLQLDKTVTSLLAGVGVVGLALGFAFQDIAANFMSGVIMAIREPFGIGDVVETHGITGKVLQVDLRATVLDNFAGQRIIIPNKDVLQSPITNYTESGKRRLEFPVGVSYATDLEKAERVARETLEALTEPVRDTSLGVDVYYTDLAGSSIDLILRLWVDLRDPKADFLGSRSTAIKSVKQAFDTAGITIPFPIQTLDFGIEGGADLAEMLSEQDGEGAAEG